MAVLVQITTLLVRIERLTAVAADAVADIEARWSPSWRDAHLLAVAFMDMGARDLASIEHLVVPERGRPDHGYTASVSLS